MTSTASAWASHLLSDLVDVLDYARVPVSAREREARPGIVPYYGATGRVGSINDALFDEDLVLLGEDGVQFFDPAKPKAYLVTGPSWVNNHAHVLRARRELIDRRYLCHYLNNFNYQGYANGTTRLKLTQAAMRRIPVHAPDLDEQRSIADMLDDHLSSLDAASASLAQSGTRADQLVTSTLLTDLAVKSAPRLPLKTLLSQPLANGRSVPTQQDGFPVLRLTALTTGGIDLSQRKGGAWTEKEAKSFLVAQGDFLVSRGNGSLRLVARGGLVRDIPNGVAYPDTLIRVRTDDSRMDPEYLCLLWNSPLVRGQIESMARTTAGIYKVNQKQLEGINIPTPDIRKQQRLVLHARAASDAAARVHVAAIQAQQRGQSLRRSLLMAAFTGRLTRHSTRAEEMASV
jgi:type I restriction enzyme S subunit